MLFLALVGGEKMLTTMVVGASGLLQLLLRPLPYPLASQEELQYRVTSRVVSPAVAFRGQEFSL